MLVAQEHLSKAVCEKYFRAYSPTLGDYCDRFVNLLSAELPFLTADMVYICPLCIRNYLVYLPEGLFGSAEFSLDHLPPESVGGRFRVLTCKKCNNDAGYYEAELLKLMDFGSVPDKRNGSLFSHARVANSDTGESFPVSIRLDKNTANIEFHPEAKRYNEKLKRFINGIHSHEFGSLDIMVGSPDEKKVAKALMKSAYLLGFVWWGYEFVYSTHAQLIRDVLQGQRAYPTRVPIVWKEETDNAQPEGIGILRWNGIKKAFLVTLKLSTSTVKIVTSTLIPNPTQDGWEKLSELNTIVEGKVPTATEIISIPRRVQRGGYTRSWLQPQDEIL